MVNVIGDFYLDADANQFVVGNRTETTDRKTGKRIVYMVNSSYHGSIEKALENIRKRLHRNLVKNFDGDISELLDEIRKLDAEFKERMGGV